MTLHWNLTEYNHELFAVNATVYMQICYLKLLQPSCFTIVDSTCTSFNPIHLCKNQMKE